MKTTIGREKKRGRYLLLKITEDTWKLKHVHLWEVAHQCPVPKGHCIKFLDGDVRNFSIDNLQCMTKSEVSKYNIQKISKKKPLGTEKNEILKGRYQRTKIKTAEGWKIKHVHLWEQAHKKKLPKNHYITFIDGNKNNFAIENLKCIHRRELELISEPPIGSEHSEGHAIAVKIAKGVWKAKHVHLWEQAHKKPVPKGHCIIFLDKNKRNYSIDNLECCSYAETLAINKKRGRSHFQDVTKAHVLLAKIYTSLKKRKKEKGL